jgi:eukaryotic-like serine/threonine-protein kinase
LLRQALAALGQAGRIERPSALDGMSAPDLVRIAQAALSSGLLDDLSWAPPEGAGVALYELTSALPPGKERHALGRRLLAQVYSATAPTFAAIATRMASGSRRALEAPALRARVQLVFSLPLGANVFVDPLALTLVARRELFERWVERPSRGTLPQRKLAATLLERAAREAVRSSRQGDPGPLTLLRQPWVQGVFQSLLLDREPLVWRHAASCRGLLAAVDPELREEIDLQLDPQLTPTEWRRAAVSLVTCLVHDAGTTLQQCRSLLHSELGRRHPSLLATLVWGLGPVVEDEPEAALELLEFLSEVGREDIAENVVALLSEVAEPSFGLICRERLRRTLGEQISRAPPERRVALERTLAELGQHPDSHTLPQLVRRALRAFEHEGAQAACAAGKRALGYALRLVEGLEAPPSMLLPSATSAPGAQRYLRLSELDQGALENSRLYDLLLLDRAPGDSDASVADVEQLYDRLGAVLMRADSASGPRDEYVFERQRWLALLHLIDVETATRSGAEHVAERVAWRIKTAMTSMLARLAQPNAEALHRVLCATLARTFDAAVREGVADVADLLLVCLDQLHQSESVDAVIQASTSEDVRHALGAYFNFLQPQHTDAPPSSSELRAARPLARRFMTLSTGLHVSCSYRGEALRRTLLRLAEALQAIADSRGLSELCTTRPSVLEALETAVADLLQMSQSVAQQLLDRPADSRPPAHAVSLHEVVALAVNTQTAPDREQLGYALQALCDPICLPLALPLSRALAAIEQLPPHAPDEQVPSTHAQATPTLPDWLLPRRTIGSFYVVRPLGSGGTSSVFVARRIEARHQSDAELYALKVPFYDANVARHLTEQEFLQLFRQEAGALLSLPKHPNLARFVNFDAEAKPKPILVMELIAGESLDDTVRYRRLNLADVLGYLRGILNGLDAMHQAGVAHLDVKPANVILRDNRTPVLVDFGLSGRQIRPGCGTLEYCAPEILKTPTQAPESAAPCDVYAFACLAFEALTGEFLIEGSNESSLIANQVAHDGWPPRLVQLSKVRGAREITMVLARCLRRDPKIRPTARELYKSLGIAGHTLEGLVWPLPLRDRAA